MTSMEAGFQSESLGCFCNIYIYIYFLHVKLPDVWACVCVFDPDAFMIVSSERSLRKATFLAILVLPSTLIVLDFNLSHQGTFLDLIQQANPKTTNWPKDPTNHKDDLYLERTNDLPNLDASPFWPGDASFEGGWVLSNLGTQKGANGIAAPLTQQYTVRNNHCVTITQSKISYSKVCRCSWNKSVILLRKYNFVNFKVFERVHDVDGLPDFHFKLVITSLCSMSRCKAGQSLNLETGEPEAFMRAESYQTRCWWCCDSVSIWWSTCTKLQRVVFVVWLIVPLVPGLSAISTASTADQHGQGDSMRHPVWPERIPRYIADKVCAPLSCFVKVISSVFIYRDQLDVTSAHAVEAYWTQITLLFSAPGFDTCYGLLHDDYCCLCLTRWQGRKGRRNATAVTW